MDGNDICRTNGFQNISPSKYANDQSVCHSSNNNSDIKLNGFDTNLEENAISLIETSDLSKLNTSVVSEEHDSNHQLNGHSDDLSEKNAINLSQLGNSSDPNTKSLENKFSAMTDASCNAMPKTRKDSSRRSSSDGAAKALEASNLSEIQKPFERSRSCSDSDERAAAMKAKINEKFDQIQKEVTAKTVGLFNADGDHSNDSALTNEAVLNLNDCEKILLSPDQSCMPAEDTCVFTSGSPAGVLCELRQMPADSKRMRSVSAAEFKELAYARLQDELRKAQKELKLKDVEVARLSQIRDQVGEELEDLTASLFEEAHNMVREANVKQANAEKLLKEANLKIEVLQAEVQALKTLVITSTPSMPNRHLHPQIEKKTNSVRSLFQGHKRCPSNYELASSTESPPGSPVRELPSSSFTPDFYEVDPVCHQEFVDWRQNPDLDKNLPFLARIYKEDILPCLTFANGQLSEEVLRAIENSSIAVELVNGKNPFPKRCTLLDAPRLCKYRMKLGDSNEWHYISQLCRNRIAAVCDFFCYLRYIKQGLVKNAVNEVYWEIMRKRKDITLSRLGIISP